MFLSWAIFCHFHFFREPKTHQHEDVKRWRQRRQWKWLPSRGFIIILGAESNYYNTNETSTNAPAAPNVPKNTPGADTTARPNDLVRLNDTSANEEMVVKGGV